MIITNSLLAAILVTCIVQCIVLTMYLRRKKPGPKPKKKTAKNNHLVAEPLNDSSPRKRFRAQTYEERQMK
jgi:hypothetical protein